MKKKGTMPLSWYEDSKPHKFCPGCGHGLVLKVLGELVDEMDLRERLFFGCDIGCSLLAWNFFNVDSVQTHLPAAKKTLGIPASDLARRELHPRVFNMVVLGAAVALTEVVREEFIHEALEAKLGDKFAKNPDLKDLNHRALKRGRELALQGR